MRTYGRSLSEFVKILRKDNDWSMEDLGKELGVTRQYVHQVESETYKSVPVSFTINLMRICDKTRREWLSDLLAESYHEWIAQRMKRKG